MPLSTMLTFHCASYDTGCTESSLSSLWAIKEVNTLMVCSSTRSVFCVSGVSLRIQTIVTDATVLENWVEMHIKWLKK